MLGFFDTIQEAWSKEISDNVNHLVTLHIKLSRVAKALRAWARTLIPQGKVVATVCREVVEQLERAQEDRQLSLDEISLLKHMKHRIAGLAVIEKSRAKQKSRIT
jgi:RNA polymerase-interacting CarD/CdnL/TRCF family regulator